MYRCYWGSRDLVPTHGVEPQQESNSQRVQSLTLPSTRSRRFSTPNRATNSTVETALGSSSQTVVNLIGPDFTPAIINSSSGAKFAGRITAHHGIFGTYLRGAVFLESLEKALVIIAILLMAGARHSNKRSSRNARWLSSSMNPR